MTKEHRLYEKPIPVKAIDTTGAGDAFAAAFLYQLLRDGISREQLPHLSKDILQVYLRRVQILKWCSYSLPYCSIMADEHWGQS